MDDDMRHKVLNERGGALLISLSLVAMLTLLGILAVETSNTGIELSGYQVQSDKSFYIANAGANRAIMKLTNDATWRAGFNDEPWTNGVYTVAITDSLTDTTLADTVILTATGTYEHGLSTIEVTLVPAIFNPFLHAMFGRNSVDIRNNMTIDSYNSDSGTYEATQENLGGDLGSNGNIIVKNGATVGGDVSTSLTGGLTIHNRSDVLGDTTDAAPVYDVPDTPQSTFNAMEASNDNSSGLSGSYTYNPLNHTFQTTGNVTFGDGVYYFSDFTLKNSASVTIAPGANVEIYITGAVEIKNSGTINASGNPSELKMFIQNDFVLKNSAEMSAVIYAPSAQIDLRNSADYYGAVVGNDVLCHNSATFHYDQSLADLTFGGGATMQPVAWRVP
ncbi:MAG: hypothetical protein V3V99_01400 [candidate division Zixibacteria bacterium]